MREGGKGGKGGVECRGMMERRGKVGKTGCTQGGVECSAGEEMR